MIRTLNKTETQAMLEAQLEAENILRYCFDKYNLKPIKIKVKNIRGGTAHYLSRFISIPIWTYTQGIAYFYAYILHEISHFINYDSQNFERGHGKKFKGIEKTLLKDFSLIPIYSKAYIKGLISENGQVIWERKWR